MSVPGFRKIACGNSISIVKSEYSNYVYCVIINIYMIHIVNNQLWNELLTALLTVKPY